jgi:demethylmenaquinone methyltransferase/2-methoxy-6-polyprenyl-1,4-benzoquinol methylase
LELHEGYRNAKRFFTYENAANYDSIVQFTTLGQDSVWKSHIIKIIGKRHIVLDIACGTGILSSMLKAKDAAMKVISLDLEFNYLQIAKGKRKNLVLTNGTAEILPFKNEYFDSVISSYLAKYVNMKIVVDECWRILRPNGIVVFHDFIYPKNQIFRKFWHTYFMILKVGGHITKTWLTVFKELDKLVEASRWVELTLDFLKGKGFRNIVCTHYTFGTAAIISARKP